MLNVQELETRQASRQTIMEFQIVREQQQYQDAEIRLVRSDVWDLVHAWQPVNLMRFM